MIGLLVKHLYEDYSETSADFSDNSWKNNVTSMLTEFRYEAIRHRRFRSVFFKKRVRKSVSSFTRWRRIAIAVHLLELEKAWVKLVADKRKKPVLAHVDAILCGVGVQFSKDTRKIVLVLAFIHGKNFPILKIRGVLQWIENNLYDHTILNDTLSKFCGVVVNVDRMNYLCEVIGSELSN